MSSYSYNPPSLMSDPIRSALALPLVHSRQVRDTDLSGAFSGYGHQAEYCPEGIPVEQALFGILAAFGASFGFLYRAVTMATMGRRRRKRSEDEAARAAAAANGTLWEEDQLNFYQMLQEKAADMAWFGTSYIISRQVF